MEIGNVSLYLVFLLIVLESIRRALKRPRPTYSTFDGPPALLPGAVLKPTSYTPNGRR